MVQLKKRKMPTVSVIMPAFNMERYIAASIQSVIDQDYSDWELLIVDDGSVDNTAKVCEPFLKDDRIKYFYKPNGGLPSARNHAIERASGEFLALLDSDDLWLSNKLSVSIATFEKGDHDLLFTNGYNFHDNSDLSSTASLKKFPLHCGEYYGESGIREFIKRNCVHVPTVVVKKEVIVRLGGFPNLSFAEDYCMWFLLLINGYKLKGIDCSLSLYRERPDSMLHSEKRVFSKLFKVFKFLIAQYPDLIKYRKEFIGFLKLYLTFDYDRNSVAELKEMMTVLNINSKLVGLIVNIN